VLSDRFRDITITLPAPPHPAAALPVTWLVPEIVDHIVRFVHSDYQGTPSNRELTHIFPAATNIAIEPMSLRSIFLAIAKSSRTHNHSAVDGRLKA
jgi:ABC-2 type transport system ATP-binding protein